MGTTEAGPSTEHTDEWLERAGERVAYKVACAAGRHALERAESERFPRLRLLVLNRIVLLLSLYSKLVDEVSFAQLCPDGANPNSVSRELRHLKNDGTILYRDARGQKNGKGTFIGLPEPGKVTADRYLSDPRKVTADGYVSGAKGNQGDPAKVTATRTRTRARSSFSSSEKEVPEEKACMPRVRTREDEPADFTALVEPLRNLRGDERDETLAAWRADPKRVDYLVAKSGERTNGTNRTGLFIKMLHDDDEAPIDETPFEKAKSWALATPLEGDHFEELLAGWKGITDEQRDELRTLRGERHGEQAGVPDLDPSPPVRVTPPPVEEVFGRAA
jgi:hypothetical protein